MLRNAFYIIGGIACGVVAYVAIDRVLQAIYVHYSTWRHSGDVIRAAERITEETS